MKIRNITSFVAALAIMALVAAPVAIAADLTGVGYIDQATLGSLPQFQKANQQVAQFKAQLDPQFSAAMRRAGSAAAQQRVQGEFQQKLLNEQRQVLGPLFARAQAAIAQVSANQSLSVIVDKRIVVYGGTDITKNVVDLFNGPGPVVAPINTPPPSSIGFVDQSQIDQLPKVKKANDDFSSWAADQRAQAIKQMQGAKNNAQQQQQIFANYQKALSAQQDKVLTPVLHQERDAMGSAASKKQLILVVDRSDVIYGGTDITQDVQNALK